MSSVRAEGAVQNPNVVSTTSYPLPPIDAKIKLELPPSEDRIHRYFRLKNGVECVVVSDAGCDKAAAAVDVGVGSLEDREGLDGCAHFW
jgi:insulysin